MYVSTTEVSVPEAMTIEVTEGHTHGRAVRRQDHLRPVGLVSQSGIRSLGGKGQLGTDRRGSRGFTGRIWTRTSASRCS